MILTWVLNFLGGGVLKSILGHLEKRKELELGRDKLQTEITISEIQAEMSKRLAQRDVLVKESESPIQWLPRFLFGMTAWLYFCSVVIDSIFDLPGVILELPPAQAAIIATVVGGLFLDSVSTKVSRALKK
jgi:hypothetical protein